jgi:CDP-diacylglycerol--glycerol-3-phosphate 3-phosphatidyltransferase
MIPNLITLSRIPLLIVVVALLYGTSAEAQYVAAGLVVVLILFDMLDGMVARAMKQTSVVGSVLDIAADRTVELVMWIVYADLDLIPVVIPIFVVARGVFVDALRAVAPAQGLTPFDLMRSRVGRFLVKSPWLRTPYGIVKAIAFFLLALERGLALTQAPAGSGVGLAAQIAAWLAVFLCAARGIPVLIEAPHALTAQAQQ